MATDSQIVYNVLGNRPTNGVAVVRPLWGGELYDDTNIIVQTDNWAFAQIRFNVAGTPTAWEDWPADGTPKAAGLHPAKSGIADDAEIFVEVQAAPT